jgi:hypothetical protein
MPAVRPATRAARLTNIEIIGVDQVDLMSPSLKKDARR